MRTQALALGAAIALVLSLGVLTLTGGSGAAVAADPRLADEPLAAPGDWFDSQRAIGTDSGAYARALEQAAAIGERTAAVAADVAGASWRHMGPTNFGGRVVDIAPDVDDLNTVFIAAASGGVWKSTDAGTTFTRSWPDELTQAMGALAMGADGTLYAGTGEPQPGGGSITYGGTGMYRSTDKGATWEHVGLSEAGAFGRIFVDPANPQRIFAAALGDLFVPGGERGLYRSLDGGDTWERVLAGDNDTTGAIDVEIDPGNPDHVIASTWDRVRFPTHRVYSGPGSKLYRSLDGGESWTAIENVTMPDPADNGRIGLAFSPSDPNRIYTAIFNVATGRFGGLWTSADNGATFTQQTPPAMLRDNLSTFGWWFGRIWVDPRSADHVVVAGVELMSSRDGGRTFVPQGVSLAGVATGAHQVIVHADQQALAWHPTLPNRVYLGNDGGFYRSEANAVPGSWVAAASQGWTQHYSVDVGEQTPNRIVSGLQDNLCQQNAPAGGLGQPGTWTKYGLCGDGLQTLINPVDETITYGCSQYGGCGRQRLGVLDPTYGNPPGRKGWFAPLEFDPTNPSIMYYGSDRLYRSTNGGSSWTAISPDLTGNPEQLDPNSGYRIYGTLTTVAVARSATDTIMVGTDVGKLWRTTDRGQTWTELDAPELPDAWITRVAIDPADAQVGYVAYSGYRSGDDAATLLRTDDGGATWTDISGDLPRAPVNDVVVIGEDLAVASDVGVFLSRDAGATWLRLGGNLPAVPVMDLRFHQGTNTLTAATFGHGIQRIDVP
jgi:photosystem II stability/assembly factor-like uncharacterized protein